MRNHQVTRRDFIQSSLAAALIANQLSGAENESALKIAPFRYDVTPPVGHPLCGGWITPVVDCEDELEAIGFVLLGLGKPIVICSVDWTGILNEAHVAWRQALADAAGTTIDRVAVQCVHQHDAPFACTSSEKMIAEQNAGLSVVNLQFFDDCLKRGAAAVRAALPKARPVTHLAHAQAPVHQVASNRRVDLSPEGKVRRMRGSACREADLVAMPEGLIDPMLKTVAFYSGAEKVVSCHYYATHPMSHYGQGHVSSDFCGLARKQVQMEDPGCQHIYFTGAAGNIAAGKYNDGSPEARVQLTRRMYEGINASEKLLQPAPIQKATWQTQEVLPPTNPVWNAEQQRSILTNKDQRPVYRLRGAMILSWIQRVENRLPIILSALNVDGVTLLHLPAESFLEYQLRAQQIASGRFVATAAYGDGGPWYIPVKEAYPQGGYEVSVAMCSDAADDILTQGIRKVIQS